MDVHHTYYRAMSDTIERAKIAKLLILADEGKIGNYAGKSLEDLQYEGKL